MKDVFDLIIGLKGKGLYVNELEGQIKVTGALHALTEKDKESIRSLKDQLLQFLKSNKSGNEKAEVITAAAKDDSYALSSSQMRLWVLSQFDGINIAYNIPIAYVFEGDFDLAMLEDFFKRLIKRHEILRTVFRENSSNEIRQYILSPEETGFKINYKDFRNSETKQEEIKKHIYSQGLFSFDLSKAPLFKACICHEEDHKWVFSFVIHHIISDGWSMSILVKELLQFYTAQQHKESATAALKIQYKDYALWQKKQLQSKKNTLSKNYWISRFKGDLPEITLPLAIPRPSEKSYRGDIITSIIDKKRVDALKAICLKNGGTFFMGLVASVKALLHNYTGLEDLIIGTPVAGRDHKELEEQLGFYVNTLALRTTFKKNESFIQLFERVKETIMSAYEHQAYPIDELIDDLQLKRDMSRNALFDIMVVLQNADINKAEGLEFGGVKIKNYPHFKRSASLFDVTFEFLETAEHMELVIEYNPDLYSYEAIEQLSRHFDQLLTAVTSHPSVAIDETDYLDASEKQKLLQGFNDTSVAFGENRTIVELFEEQVVRKPGNACLVFNEKTLTYAEVNAAANQLAHYLGKKYALVPEDAVGIKLERSEWLVITALAVMKLRAAYVPIDLEYPQERIRYIENNSNCKLIIDVSEMENFQNVQEDYSPENQKIKPESHHLAYIIYTSGSTGNPKGVLVEHRSLVNIGLGWKEAYKLDSFPVRLLQIAGFSFDVFVGDMLRTLLNGGCMVICPSDFRFDPESLYHLLTYHKISLFESTPGLIFPVMEFIRESALELPELKLLILGSDTVNAQRFNELSRWLGNKVRIINSYGVTEATIDSTYFDAGEMFLKGNVPIGKPFHNISVYILNEKLKPQPPGVFGELHISGDGLARGYLNNGIQDEARFIENPYMPGKKMYKTGDLAKWLPDGNVEFLGRNDEQLKIRGYRIETAEIANALSAHELITDAVVTGKENRQGEKVLVAYMVCRQGVEITEIRTFLSAKLPSYMLPAHYIVIDSVPLTPNGKLDKKNLPDPEELNLYADAGYVVPQNEMQQEMVELWAETLGRKQIGIKDDFFNCGGHSLKAVQLLNKIYKTFHVKLKLRELFNTTVLEEQCELIAGKKKMDFTSIPVLPVQASYPLSSSQQRIWILSQFEQGSIAYNMSGTFIFEGLLDKERLNASFNSLIKRHEILRTVFKIEENEGIRQIVQDASLMQFVITEKNAVGIKETELHALLGQESMKAFDLEKGPLLRAALFELTKEKAMFVFTMHHIICDGWSMNIIIKELLTLYNARENAALNLQPLKIQYRDFASWQQERLKSAELEIHRNYWLTQFDGKMPVLDFPTDHPRPPVKTYSGDVVNFNLGHEISEGLKTISTQNGSTLFMSLLSAINILLYKYTGQTDIVIGTSTAGREHTDLEDQVGFYINALALRTRFHEADSFSTILSSVKQLVLNAFEHQAYPFDKLVEELQLQRKTGRAALFDVMVDLQNTDVELYKADISTGIEHLSIKEYPEVTHKISKFDLTFTFEEKGDELIAAIEYNTGLFDKETILRLSENLQCLIRSAISAPGRFITSLNAVNATERNLLLNGFNDTLNSYPENKTVLDLFKLQAKANPDAIAITFESNSLTYKELDERSDALASHLQETYFVKPNDFIALMLDNSEKVIVSILAVLKSGSAYVPLDPGYPAARLAYILADCKPKVLITESNYLFSVSEYEGAVFAADIQLDALEIKEAFISSVSGSDLAYVIYTSGSTGNPKGVMVTHNNFFNYLSWASDYYYRISDGGNFGLFSSISFDLTVTSIFIPLIKGKTIKVLNTGSGDFSEIIHAYFTEPAPDSIKLTPSHLQLIVSGDYNTDSLKKVILGGEPVSKKLISDFRKNNPHTEIYNEYGPTESTVGCTIFKIDEVSYSHVPVGKPISNTRIYILDKKNGLCPAGVPGEICVAGAGVAKGYLNRAELSAEKFIADPFVQQEDMYKTGDVGRWLRDGNIEFLGRNDDQVKIRGYRIELNEIENVLKEHSQISEAVVVVKENDKEEKDLIAYIVSESPLSVGDLRLFSGTKLPAYMIPDYYVQLDEIPLTPNGKADRRSLPDPYNLFINNNVFEAPSDEIEERVLLIWKNILGRENIGVKDDFFELGGHSIKAINILSKVQKEFGVKLTLESLFEYPNIRYMADQVKNLTWLLNNDSVEDTDEYEKIKI